jgi:hypothetical protein
VTEPGLLGRLVDDDPLALAAGASGFDELPLAAHAAVVNGMATSAVSATKVRIIFLLGRPPSSGGGR